MGSKYDSKTAAARYEKIKPYIEEASQITGIPKSVIAAMAYMESTFQHKTGSNRKGAQGYMQLREIAVNDIEHDNKDRTDPRENVIMGAKYLKKMVDRFDGDLTLGLAAYNAGASTVKKAKGVPNNPETQAYINNFSAIRDSLENDFEDLRPPKPPEPIPVVLPSKLKRQEMEFNLSGYPKQDGTAVKPLRPIFELSKIKGQ